MHNISCNNKTGIALIEAVVAVSIVTLSVFGLIAAFQDISQEAFKNTERTQARLLMSEGFEAVRAMRAEGWSSNIAPLSEDEVYWLRFVESNGEWQATTSPQIIDGMYDRRFTISAAHRNFTTNDLIESGGYEDDQTKQVSMEVVWGTSTATSSVSADFYIANLFDN